ncbi:DUF4236 domain-containing protein [Caballeronia jiangsuensis]|uniref:DUF4236 domain-containing protein n=1 Tax=Caballeronia jiangsuensis TaxID=1458357 RepID=A0ABW9CGH8_9BURK
MDFTDNKGEAVASGNGLGNADRANALRRTQHAVRAAITAVTLVNPQSTEELSKREQSARDFTHSVQGRIVIALHQYLYSQGVFVLRSDLSKALAQPEQQQFLARLADEFEITNRAVRLAADIGSISLAEKQKAMTALYEIEAKCADAHGDRRALEGAAVSLQKSIRAWPGQPRFIGLAILAFIGCGALYARSYPFGLTLLAIAVLLGASRLRAFERSKREVLARIIQANGQFESLVTDEISERPVFSKGEDRAKVKATALGVISAITATTALIFGVQRGAADVSHSARQQAAANSSGQSAPAATLRANEPMPAFEWLIGKAPSAVVDDPRFRAAFSRVGPKEWRRISERLDVSDASGIQLKNGFYFAEGCKAHFCGSDIAAFAIDASTGKGDVLYRTTFDQPLGKSITRTFSWANMPSSATPLAPWAALNNM